MRGLPKPLGRVFATLALAWSVWLFLPGWAVCTAGDSKQVRIGVLATRGVQRCLEKWGETARYLTAEIPGYSFVVQPLAHEEVGPAVQRGEIAFILTNPSLYVELEHRYKASRIVTLKNLHLGKAYTVYAAVILRRADREDIHDFADLRGKRFMAVDEQSFGGWQMAWREMKEHGLDPRRDLGDLRFGGTHDAVVYAVAEGKVDAGTVRADTLGRMAKEGKIRLDQFRVIHQQPAASGNFPFPCSTRVYPEWPLARATGTSDELAEKVAITLERMSADSPAARAAGCAGWTIPHNYQSVRDCLKALQIGPYADYGKVTAGAVVRRYWPWLTGALGFLMLAGVVLIQVTRLNGRLRHALLQYNNELAERRRTEESLRNSEQLRAASEKLNAVGRLAAGVAHEINNPLTSVLTFSHMLREKANLDDQDRQDLDVIIHETTRASAIVRNLLDFAREQPAIKNAMDIDKVIRRTIQLLGSQKAFQHVTIREALREDLPQVDGDANQLQQVLLNLSLNACEAMPDGGTLTIATAVQDGKVRVRVSDTGCGIKGEHLDRIFEPFFSTKPVGMGTGLGLSVSYGIVQQHGGALEVESEPGKGTTFTMLLPSIEARPSDPSGDQVIR